MSSSILVYGAFEGWAPSDCVYFAVTTMTTVGFGDLGPAHTASRMFACAWILTALVFLASGISQVLSSLVSHELEVADRALRQRFRRRLTSGGADKTAASNGQGQVVKQFLLQVAALCGFVALASLLVRSALKLSAVDALYFSIVTLTTTGFGDIVPQTAGAKWAISLLCIVGVPLFGSLLASLASLIYGRRHVSRIRGGLTAENLMCMQQFAEAMHSRGLYPKLMELSDALAGERRIHPFEFCCFRLVQNHIISMEDMDLMLRNFEELDLRGDGYLWSKDVQKWEEQRRKKSAGVEP